MVFDGSTSDSFNIRSGVTEQGCVLAPTLFGILFALKLKHVFGSVTEGIYLRARSDGKLFNLSRLRANSKVQLKGLRDFLCRRRSSHCPFSRGRPAAHDSFQQGLSRLRTHHQSEKNTGHGTRCRVSPSSISISDHELDVVHDFVYLRSISLIPLLSTWRSTSALVK